jgi:hypothetical protein
LTTRVVALSATRKEPEFERMGPTYERAKGLEGGVGEASLTVGSDRLAFFLGRRRHERYRALARKCRPLNLFLI